MSEHDKQLANDHVADADGLRTRQLEVRYVCSQLDDYIQCECKNLKSWLRDSVGYW